MADDARTSPCTVDAGTWTAWLTSNFPSPRATLTVRGTVHCPSAGWKCVLTQSPSPGAERNDIQLELDCVPPTSAAAATLTDEQVVFVKVYADRQDGPRHQVDVRWNPPFSIRIEEAV